MTTKYETILQWLTSAKSIVERLLDDTTETAFKEGVDHVVQAKAKFLDVLIYLAGWDDWKAEEKSTASESRTIDPFIERVLQELERDAGQGDPPSES